MNITVYLGSSTGNDPAYAQAARELGTWIGSNGHRLVYGGSQVGLMGMLADAVLEAGGQVTGVEPRFMIEVELQHDSIDELIMVETMAERMTKMIELGDAFVALPGGVGTLEEISEVASRIRLNLTQAPCVFCNVKGYYDDFIRYLDRMCDDGFIRPHEREAIVFANSIDEVAAAVGCSSS